tara:strand:+ start:2090 stop:2509 length:420 start_codon:yes stop_codon:yes gene_type:complete
MSKVEIISYTPPSYWSIPDSYDGIYSGCRFHRDGEFVTRFPIIMKAKVNIPLKNHLGEKEYISYILDILNTLPPVAKPKTPVVKSKGRKRKSKPPSPNWGNLEIIQYKFRKEKELDIVELTMYTDKKKHKNLINFNTLV